MVEGQLRDSIRSIPKKILHNENQSTIELQTDTSGNPPKPVGADETGDASQIIVWDIPRTIGRSGGRRTKSVEQKADQRWIRYLR